MESLRTSADRVATRRQSLRRPNMISMRLRVCSAACDICSFAPTEPIISSESESESEPKIHEHASLQHQTDHISEIAHHQDTLSYEAEI